MAEVWNSFTEKLKERQFLPPLQLGGEEFLFPASPPAILFFKIQQYEQEHGRPMPDTEVIATIGPLLLESETQERLLHQITVAELSDFIFALFRAWGWYSSEPEAEAPNRKARRASTKGSSKGSARSKQTSNAVTASS